MNDNPLEEVLSPGNSTGFKENTQGFNVDNEYQGLVECGGKHHEIYLGDPRRAAAEKLKTILRHPVKVRSNGSN